MEEENVVRDTKMKKNFKILDCTFRDGGYYTDWDFSDDVVSQYFSAMNGLPVDYIEIGYRNNSQEEYLGKFGYTPLPVVESIRHMCSKKIAVMLNEKSTVVSDLDRLLSPMRGLVDMVRIAVDPKNFSRAVSFAREVKAVGFEVGFNLMYMSKWKSDYPEVFQELSSVNDVVDVLYMVDSFGGVTPNELTQIIGEIRQKTKCCIGFHGHNNLQLAMANTIRALELGVDYIDATILGMGRGAGNLCTELLLTYLNSKGSLNVDFNVLGEVVNAFNPLYERYHWGTNLPYMIAGANQIPQKEVMQWVTNRVYSFNSVVHAVNARRIHDADEAKYPQLEIHHKYKDVLVVGGGNSVKEHQAAIRAFIEGRNDIALIFATAKQAAPFKNLEVPKYYCLVGDEGRRLTSIVGADFFDGICVLPSYPRVMGIEVPQYACKKTFELKAVDFVDKYSDSVTTVALQTALLLSGEKIYVVGYDGYLGTMLSEKEVSLTDENNYIFEAYSNYYGQPLVSLTDSIYYHLQVKSIYQYI